MDAPFADALSDREKKSVIKPTGPPAGIIRRSFQAWQGSNLDRPNFAGKPLYQQQILKR
jgi:hypothetical protein